MRKEQAGALAKTYSYDILKYCDGKRGVKDITELTGLSYKTVFLKLKELEEAGIVEIKRSRRGESNQIGIKSEYKGLVEGRVGFMDSNQEKIKEILKDKNKKDFLIKILETIKEKRFLDSERLLELIDKEESPTDLIMLRTSLLRTGLIKERYEITKKGIKFLKEIQKKKPKSSSQS